MRGVYSFELAGRRCEVYVWNHCPSHWGVSATDDDGSLGPCIHLRKERYPSAAEAAERAIAHFSTAMCHPNS